MRENLKTFLNPGLSRPLNTGQAGQAEEIPAEWQTREVGFNALTEDQRADLGEVSAQLDGFVNTLSQIQTVANTLLNPLIATLRAVEDPYATVLNQLRQEVEKFIAALENTGKIHILDFFFMNIGDDFPTGVTVGEGEDAKFYGINQLSLRNAFQDFADVVNEGSLNLRNSRFNLRSDDARSQRQQAINKAYNDNLLEQANLTRAEAEALAIRVIDAQQAAEYLQQFHDDVDTLMETLADRYGDNVDAINALQTKLKSEVAGGTRIYEGYYDATYNTTKTKKEEAEKAKEEDGKGNSGGGEKVSIAIPKLSPFMETSNYVAEAATAALKLAENPKGFLAIKGTANIDDEIFNIDYQQSSVLITSKATKDETNNYQAIDVSKIDSTQTEEFSAFISEVRKIEKKQVSALEKRKEIYAYIENNLKKSSDEGTTTRTYINVEPNGKKSKVLNSTERSRFKNYVLSSEALQGITGESAINKIINLSIDRDNGTIIETQYGYFNDASILIDVREELFKRNELELRVAQEIIRQAQVAIEYAGRAERLNQGPVYGPRRVEPNRVPPKVPNAGPTTAEGPEATTTKTESSIDAAYVGIIDSILKDLDSIDTLSERADLLKKLYRARIQNLISNLRAAFALIQSGVEDLQSEARANLARSDYRITTGSQSINQISTNNIQNAFMNIIKGISDIKVAFQPFFVKRQILNAIDTESASEVDGGPKEGQAAIQQNRKTELQIEKNILDSIIGPSDDLGQPLNGSVHKIIQDYLRQFLENLIANDTDINPLQIYKFGYKFNDENYRLTGFDPDLIDYGLEARTNFIRFYSEALTNVYLRDGNFIERPSLFFTNDVFPLLAKAAGDISFIVRNALTNNERRKIELANQVNDIEEQRSCLVTGSNSISNNSSSLRPGDPDNVVVEDERKAVIVQQLKALNVDIENLEKRIVEENRKKKSLIDQLNEINRSGTLEEKNSFFQNLNISIRRTGGFLYAIGTSQTGATVEETNNFVEGEFNNRLNRLIEDKRTLEATANQTDLDIAELRGDQSVKSRVLQNRAITEQELQEIQERIEIKETALQDLLNGNPTTRYSEASLNRLITLDREREKTLKQELFYLEEVEKNILDFDQTASEQEQTEKLLNNLIEISKGERGSRSVIARIDSIIREIDPLDESGVRKGRDSEELIPGFDEVLNLQYRDLYTLRDLLLYGGTEPAEASETEGADHYSPEFVNLKATLNADVLENDETELLFLRNGLISTNPEVSDDVGSSDSNIINTEDIVSLFKELAALHVRKGTSSRIDASFVGKMDLLFEQEELFAPLDLTTGVNYAEFVGYSEERFEGGVPDGEQPGILLPFAERINNIKVAKNKIVGLTKQSADPNRKNRAQRNDAQDPDQGGSAKQYIIPRSKNEFLNYVSRRLRNPNDVRRPIFIDDISTAKPLKALFGNKAQKQIDSALELGEMTAFIPLVTSSDLNMIIDQIVEGPFDIFLDPKSVQKRLLNYTDNISRQLSRLGNDIENVTSDVSDFFTSIGDAASSGAEAVESTYNGFKESVTELIDKDSDKNLFDRVVDAVEKEGDCQVTLQKGLDRSFWLTLNLYDLPPFETVFNTLRALSNYLITAFETEISLADLLDDLLNAFNQRINNLKSLSASIGLLIELVDYMLNFKLNTATLEINNIRSVTQLETAMRQAQNFPTTPYAQTPNDKMYILGFMLVTSTNNWQRGMRDFFVSDTTTVIDAENPLELGKEVFPFV